MSRRAFEREAYLLLRDERRMILARALLNVAKQCETQSPVGLSNQQGVMLGVVHQTNAYSNAKRAATMLRDALDAYEAVARESDAVLGTEEVAP